MAPKTATAAAVVAAPAGGKAGKKPVAAKAPKEVKAATKKPVAAKTPKAAGDKKKKKRKSKQSFSTYIYKVLKQVHKDIGISKPAMSIMNSFVNDIFECIATEGGRLVRATKKQLSLHEKSKLPFVSYYPLVSYLSTLSTKVPELLPSTLTPNNKYLLN